MEIKELQEHIDRRLDRLERKIDSVVPTVASHAEAIRSLKGFVKYGITVFLAASGFLAAAFFNKG